ncbi:hypothetical protein D9758_013039 [Tetrapyrgos nigripes]|uniref:Cation efflux protein cytoplasmic domain-containing protein n=1 Tax=Tetrapyrgos nigripes TaxID=182062 RepID=A0A8H5CQB6_9AGAR|nr:hypothetical protein D9758_013039 [Tetrapyrgos nigripes]
MPSTLRRRTSSSHDPTKDPNTNQRRSSRISRILIPFRDRRQQNDPEKSPSVISSLNLFPDNPNVISSVAGPQPSISQPDNQTPTTLFPQHNAIFSVAGPRVRNVTAVTSPQLYEHSALLASPVDTSATSGVEGPDTATDASEPSRVPPVSVMTDASTLVPVRPDSRSSYETATSSEDPRDPFNLISAYKSEVQLKKIKKQSRRAKVGEKLTDYYSKQNELILNLLKPMEEHTTDAQDEKEAARLAVQIAIYASLIANFSLCVLQMYAAISALSLSLLATGIDSVFDIGSNVLLFYLHRRANKLDNTKWPVGGARLETIGNVIYGFLMGSVNLVVIVESVQSLLSHKNGEKNEFHLPSVVSVGAALGVKLLLFLYCYSIRKYSSQVQVLWEDHRNDLWINTFGVLMSTGGRLDPTGAIIIALGIVIAWSKTIYTQFCLLAGKSAPNEFIQLLVYKTATYSKEIVKVDTVRAYHSGPNYFVEVDIVMSPFTPLWRAHDLSQKLQDEIEVLPNVERAFVHVDHETSHSPEHRKLPSFS